MTVRQIIKQAPMAYFAKAFNRLVKEKHGNIMEFRKAFYGVTADGGLVESSDQWRRWMNGVAMPQEKYRGLLGKHFGVDPNVFLEPEAGGKQLVTVPKVTEPDAPPPPPVRKLLPQFSLIITEDGSATLTLNMVVSVEVAMRAMNTLMASGVLPTGVKQDTLL